MAVWDAQQHSEGWQQRGCNQSFRLFTTNKSFPPSDTKSRDYFACWCSSTKPESLQKQGWWDRPASSCFGCWTGQRHQQVSLSCSIWWDVSQLDLQPPWKADHHKHPQGRRWQVSKALHGRDNTRQKSNTPEGCSQSIPFIGKWQTIFCSDRRQWVNTAWWEQKF